MSVAPEYETRRTAEYIARSHLIRQGYEVLRVAESHVHEPVSIHLIAWKEGGEMIFICPRSFRKGFRINEDIRRLSEINRERRFPGEVQYWIRDQNTWKRHRICAGGAVPIREF